MRPIILKVYLSNNTQTVSEVPITPETTCRDVIDCCKEPGEEHCHLAELWRGCERPIGEQERPYEILQQWGIHRDEVKFYLRHEPAVPLGQRSRRKNGMKEPESLPEATLSGGVDLTLTELQEMAARQQQQIETQQQMLVAKEQRLKYLKQQELKHQQIASENERLHKLRLRVEEQELKLRKLRALRGQVDQQKINNSSLTSELESIRALFNEKEKELAMAVSKVEELTKQLEEIRRGRLNGLSCDPSHTYSATIELEKLHRELIIRNKMNEQQNSKLNAHREVLSHRQEEMARMDKRIAELTERLRRKRSLNEQLSNQINNSNKPVQLRNNSNNCIQNNSTSSRVRPLSANVAAVEPYKHTPKEVIFDDIHTKLITNEDLPEFSPHKKDPKYQTLPYNTKFSVSEAKKVRVDSIEDLKEYSKTVDSAEKDVDTEKSSFSNDKPRLSPPSNVKTFQTTQIAHSTSNYPSNKSQNAASVDSNKTVNRENSQPSKNTISHFVPKPYGSTYSSSILAPSNLTSLRGQPEGNNGSTTSQTSKISPNNIQNSTSNNNNSSSSSRNTTLPHSVMSFHDNRFPNRPEGWVSSKFSRPIVTVASSIPPISNVQPQVRSSPIFQTSSSRVLSPVLLNHKDQDCNGPPSSAHLVPSANSPKHNISPASSNENTPKPLLSSNKDSSYSPSSNSLSSEGSNASMPSPNSSNEDIPKPTLPPRPSAPIKPTPPPRLTRMHSQDEVEQVKKIDTSQKALDSAMSILRGNSSSSSTNSGPQTNGINPPSYKFAPKTLVANAYSRRLGSTTQDQYRRIMDQLYNSTPAKQDDAESSGKNSSADQSSHKNRSDHDRPPDISPPPYSSISSSQQERPSPENEKGQVNSDQSVKTKLPLYKKTNNSDNSKLLRNGPSSPKKQLAENTRPHTNSHNGNSRSDKGYSETANIHISTNRRIEMPPDFLLPEMTPPDISSGVRDNYNNNNNNNNNKNNTLETQNYDNRYITPPRYSGSLPPSYQETEENHSKTTKLKKQQTDTENNSTCYEVQENGDISSPSPTIYPQNQQERNGHSPPKQLESKDEVDYTNKSQLSPSHQNSGQNNINGQFHPLGNVGKQSASYMAMRRKKGNLKTKDSIKNTRRVSFDPLALLLDASLEGELELVMKTAQEVPNPSAANDEGITALHNAICAGHFEIVKFLVEFGCDVNAQDSDGWTPLHCAASCNNVPMVKFLVEHGACIFSTTLSDQETAAEKCEEDEEGFDGCSEYLYSVQEKLGIVNNGAVYAVYDYDAQNPDELNFKDGDMMIVLRKGDEFEREWWWARLKDREGYIPRNLLGLYPRVPSRKDS